MPFVETLPAHRRQDGVLCSLVMLIGMQSYQAIPDERPEGMRQCRDAYGQLTGERTMRGPAPHPIDLRQEADLCRLKPRRSKGLIIKIAELARRLAQRGMSTRQVVETVHL